MAASSTGHAGQVPDIGPATPEQTILIVGASVAGVRCALALRDEGFTGAITLLEAEDLLPYDKPQLSKRIGPDDQLELLATAELLADRAIDFRPGTAAFGLDLAERTVETSAGPCRFDQLVIASGCRPRELDEPLPARAGYVRTRSDWEKLKIAAEHGGRLLVIGAGFLGLEAAAAATQLGMDAAVIDVAPRVLQRGIPGPAADLIAARHAAEGVELRLNVHDPSLTGDDRRLRADGVTGSFAVISIGAVPNTEWLAGSGLELENGVVCEDTLSAAPGIWAVGDCARWTNARYGHRERVEHWTSAVRQAQHVARTIASGVAAPFSDVPYVWSDQFDWRIQTAGRATSTTAHYATDHGAHIVLSTEEDRVTGVTTINAPAICLRARQMLQAEDPALDSVVDALRLGGLTRVE